MKDFYGKKISKIEKKISKNFLRIFFFLCDFVTLGKAKKVIMLIMVILH